LVQSVAARLGYTPNAAARSLIHRKTGLLGLIVSNISDAFAPEFIAGVTTQAIESGYTVIVGCVQESSKLQADYLQMLAEHRVEGAILASGMIGSAPDIAPFIDRGLPVVLAGRAIDGLDLDTVQVDNASASDTATTHLLSEGRTRLAFIGGSADTSTTRDRIRGFRSAMRRRGLVVPRDYIRPGEYSLSHGYGATKDLVGLDERVDGIVAADDTIALGCLDAAADLGIKIPDDLAILGFGDQPAASLRAVSLSTVRASGRDLGASAVSLLLSRLSGRPAAVPEVRILPHELVVRSTCGPHNERPTAN
jgi:LacI family transcriptional regulator